MTDTRDYYADLELPPNADEQEIKKQFRKLALKYHPDRNPGREAEVNSKFQVIQTAHEVLSDSESKAKYDASRNRAGSRYPTSSGVRGNPWANAASNFPPPPRRNANPSASSARASASASGGAQRWQTRFAQGVPPTAKQYNSADPKTKENAAKAFDHMRKAQAQTAKKTSRPTEPPPPPPRSATARQRKEAAFGTKKTTAQRPPSRDDHAAHPYPADRPVPDPLSQFRETKTPADGRQSAPYTRHGGEKTDPFDGRPMNRTRSSRKAEKSEDGTQSAAKGTETQTNANPPSEEQIKDQATTDGPSIFNFDVNDDTFVRTSPHQANFAKNSVDDINTQFSQDNGPETWRFSAGTPTQDGTGSQASPKRQQGPGADQGAADSDNPEGFNATGWAEKFGPQTFAPPQNPANNASPTRTSRANSKKSKPGKPIPGNATVIDISSDEDTYEWNGRKPAKDGLVSSPQAMEIDSPPSRPPGMPSRTNSARNINVEPSRPEWRSGDFENKPPLPERPRSPIKPTVGGSEDSEEFRTTLGDFKNVPPFTQPNAGLKSFIDLKDNLPFESRSSAESPAKLPKAQPLVFPQPPVAPRLPPTVAVDSIKPTVAAWNQYLAEFKTYLAEWEAFNSKVVDHFSARNSRTATLRAAKGYEFLGSRRDDEIQEYYNWIEQDNDVRRRWNAACDGHEMHVRELMAFREKMK
ncbi:hypothetical protein VHEMI03543 [[Torrubiella] hemipterigena]|uniref:J domain-containing protein n=1 Tax=[Torrubiella] hemipterigena TaxID=1531966 RepID=A0A0A1TBH4_9HYPO|nr:hypothetical protein VHEMI03543 [[Torrubiella] hemipterigena]